MLARLGVERNNSRVNEVGFVEGLIICGIDYVNLSRLRLLLAIADLLNCTSTASNM